MGDFTTRAYRSTDAVAVTALVNDIERADGGHPGFVPDHLDAMLTRQCADTATDTRLVFDGDRLVAVGSVSTPPAGGFAVDVNGGVHPDHRGRGIGRDLFGWQVARGTEIHDAVAPDAEWQLEAFQVGGEPTVARLLARSGFTLARYFFDMVAPTAPIDELPVPAGLRSVPVTAGRRRDVYTAHIEAFQDHWGYQTRAYADWAPMAIESGMFRPELSRIVLDGAEIAAYVLSYAEADPTRMYIGQVGTRRRWRRRGLAGALLTQVLAAGAAAGIKHASLGVDADSPTGAVGVYERAGFVVEGRGAAYRLAVPPR